MCRVRWMSQIILNATRSGHYFEDELKFSNTAEELHQQTEPNRPLDGSRMPNIEFCNTVVPYAWIEHLGSALPSCIYALPMETKSKKPITQFSSIVQFAHESEQGEILESLYLEKYTRPRDEP